MDRPFAIRDSVHNGAARLAIDGDVDLSVLQPIRDALDHRLADPASSSVTLDLSGVTFIDSSGLGLLVAGKRQAAEAEKPFHVTGAEGRTAEIIEATGLTEFLLGSQPPGP
jgi:anti-sigma B factor antagonist